MRALLLLGLLASLVAAGTAGATPSCRGSWNVVGACYAMHGRLSLAGRVPLPAGNPRARISDASGKRDVGVLGLSYNAEGPGVLSPEIVTLMQADPFAVAVEGDFTLCPLDRDTERASIRMVCIESAANLRTTRR